MTDQAQDVVEKATAMGWVPENEWKGDPAKWRPAAEFVDRGENVIPILRDRVAKLEGDLKIVIAANKQETERARAEAYAKAKAEYDQQRAQLDQLELEAFKAGDAEVYQQAKQARENLQQPEKPQRHDDPVFTEWRAKNPWYATDKELANYADAISHVIVAETGGVVTDLAGALEEMGRRTMEKFPHKFSNPKREKPSAVEGGTVSPSKKGGKTFDDLPHEAKTSYARQAARFKAAGREFTKDQYAQAYWEQ